MWVKVRAKSPGLFRPAAGQKPRERGSDGERQRRKANGKRQTANGKRQTANGKRQTANGVATSCSCLRASQDGVSGIGGVERSSSPLSGLSYRRLEDRFPPRRLAPFTGLRPAEGGNRPGLLARVQWPPIHSFLLGFLAPFTGLTPITNGFSRLPQIPHHQPLQRSSIASIRSKRS